MFVFRPGELADMNMSNPILISLGFGTAHPGGRNVVLCDGSVRTISYAIDKQIHGRPGNRKDGQPVDASRF